MSNDAMSGQLSFNNIVRFWNYSEHLEAVRVQCICI